MEIVNKTSFSLVVFVWNTHYKKTGESVIIESGQSENVRGPYIGKINGQRCYSVMRGTTTCHNGYIHKDGINIHLHSNEQVDLLITDKAGITISYFSENSKK